jgi:adenylate cyclase
MGEHRVMTELPEDKDLLRFAEFELDLGQACLRNEAGAEIPLRPKSFDLLKVLVQNAKRTLRKDMLLDAVWPNLHVTEDSLIQCVRDVRRALRDERGAMLRTVARRGYLLDVEVWQKGKTTGPPVETNPHTHGHHDVRPFVAVVPFRLSPHQDVDVWFAEGITEGIIHILSKAQDLLVISHGSVLAYAGRSDPYQVIDDAGIRYVINGSIRREGNRLRIATELADTVNGSLLLSDRYDCAATHLLDMQDQIANQIADVMIPALRQRELLRVRPRHSDILPANDLVLQTLNLLYGLNPANFHQAFGLLQQVVANDLVSGQRPPQLAEGSGLDSLRKFRPDVLATSLLIERERLEELKLLALRRRLRVNDVILEAIENHLAMHGRRPAA